MIRNEHNAPGAPCWATLATADESGEHGRAAEAR
jgi:hypothetical protein